MADLLGMKQSVYARYETGVTLPSAEVLHHICLTAGESADWLLGLSNSATHHITANNSAVSIHGNAIYNADVKEPKKKGKPK